MAPASVASAQVSKGERGFLGQHLACARKVLGVIFIAWSSFPVPLSITFPSPSVLSALPITPTWEEAHVPAGSPAQGWSHIPGATSNPTAFCGLPDTTAPVCHLALRPRHPILLLAAPGHLPQAGRWPAGQGTWASSSSKEAPKQHGSGIWQELKDLSHGRRNR